MRRRTRVLLVLALPAAAALALAACQPDDPVGPGGLPETIIPADQDTPTPDPLGIDGARVVLDGETFVSVGSVPQDAIDPTQLEAAGEAETEDGRRVSMARGQFDVVEDWALLSPSDDEWIVWRPETVLLVTQEAEPGSTLVSVERVDWPDACLGLGGPDEVCAQVITPGYRIVMEVDGQEVEYRTDLRGNFRVAGQGDDGG